MVGIANYRTKRRSALKLVVVFYLAWEVGFEPHRQGKCWLEFTGFRSELIVLSGARIYAGLRP